MKHYSVSEFKEFVDNSIINFAKSHALNPAKVSTFLYRFDDPRVKEYVTNNSNLIIMHNLNDMAYATEPYPDIKQLDLYNPASEGEFIDHMKYQVSDLFESIFYSDDKGDFNIDENDVVYVWSYLSMFITTMATKIEDEETADIVKNLVSDINGINAKAFHGYFMDTYIDDPAYTVKCDTLIVSGDGYDTFGDDCKTTKTLQKIFAQYVIELLDIEYMKICDCMKMF